MSAPTMSTKERNRSGHEFQAKMDSARTPEGRNLLSQIHAALDGPASIRNARSQGEIDGALYRIEQAHSRALTAGKYADTFGGDRVTPETYAQAIEQIGMAAVSSSTGNRQNDVMLLKNIDSEVMRLKGVVGEKLLDRDLEASRASVDALVKEYIRDNFVRTDARDFDDMLADKTSSLIAAAKREGNPLDKQFMQSLVDSGRVPDLNSAYVLHSRNRAAINSEFTAWAKAHALSQSRELREIHEKLQALGNELVKRAHAIGGLSPREGAQLASRHVTTGKGVRGIASRAGWKAKDFDRDVVSLMQVVGRALPARARVNIGSHAEIEAFVGKRISKDRGRSYQMDGGRNRLDGSDHAGICLSGQVTKRVLYHEMGHALECLNPAVNAMASAWLKRRIEGKEEQRLSALTGVKRYKAREKAVRDNFIDAYVGKVYEPRDGVQATEALSMGLERLCDPMKAAQFAVRDPDHLAMVLAALQLEGQK